MYKTPLYFPVNNLSEQNKMNISCRSVPNPCHVTASSKVTRFKRHDPIAFLKIVPKKCSTSVSADNRRQTFSFMDNFKYPLRLVLHSLFYDFREFYVVRIYLLQLPD